ncbi:hypothetical protein [Actinomadura soli]|nr:hypothetical protein [Actinomadura soli]
MTTLRKRTASGRRTAFFVTIVVAPSIGLRETPPAVLRRRGAAV